MSVDKVRKPAVRRSIFDKKEEMWRPMARFQGYQISSYGNVLDHHGEAVEPYFNDQDILCVKVSRYEWSYDGPIWQLMLRNWWQGNRANIEFKYVDGDTTNLDIDNLLPMHRDKNGFLNRTQWRIDDHGERVIDRRLSRLKVRIIETGNEFDTVRELADAIGGVPTQVYAVLRGRAKSHRGYTFETVEEL